jgi:hypothetical protein
MKKHARILTKLSLRRETVAALERGALHQAAAGHYSIPAFYTCPECAPPGAHPR